MHVSSVCILTFPPSSPPLLVCVQTDPYSRGGLSCLAIGLKKLGVRFKIAV